MVTDDGEIVRGDIGGGADGHASIVRRHVVPEQPDGVFAGYLIWLGIVDESAVQAQPWPAQLAILEKRTYCHNAYYLPGADGSLVTGRRRLGFGWYNAGRKDLLRASGALVLLLLGANFMLSADFSILNIALPEVGQAIGLEINEFPWIATAFALPAAGLSLLCGRLGELYGLRR